MFGGRRGWSVAFILALLVATGGAQRAWAQTHLVIVSGLGGQPQYTKSFGDLSSALAQAAHDRWGMPESSITWLGDSAAPRSKWYRGTSTRDNVDRALARLAERPAGEHVVLVVIGHGSGEAEDTRVSLPGPDMTARDFARVLARFGTRRIAFINLTSASGDMLPLLAGPGRVVVTATKSAFERNESQFARFFVDALVRDGADADKDARVSLMEAFQYAEQETRRFYETDGRLATEHAQLADEGQLARRFFLAGGSAASPGSGGAVGSGAVVRASNDPRLAPLYAQRQALDDELESLKKRKRAMTADAYERELERVLLAIALKGREIRQAERRSGS
jgi:hypothetical protein